MENEQTQRTVNVDRIENLIGVFGSFDENLRAVEQELQVKITDRDAGLQITGGSNNTLFAEKAIEGLLSLAAQGETISPRDATYIARLASEGSADKITDFLSGDVVCITAKGRPVKAKTLGQKNYVKAINGNTVTLAIGPAGTGKTYLAVASAVTAFRAKKVNRIVLTRPAVEAGEKLGFLPGDIQNKVDPYLRPLYDALFDMLGAETYQKYLERGNIEVAPLAYMRGRTLDDSFIILDEAQNTSREQMKMFLTRIGFGSKAVITGDITQIDLPPDKLSGLKDAARVLEDIDDIAIVALTSKDVVRHALVQKIIEAYEKKGGNYEAKTDPKQRARNLSRRV
ncbi:MAG: PhoH family protein [Oscillospiraceae bacterium]|jgi:phosphate starvation-inducible PhoH-like protein|nr:PhoH family protein [Oscillospiraceae bacterium]